MYSLAISSVFEIIILVLLGILILIAWINSKDDQSGFGCIIILLAIALFGGCLAWHDSNNRKRENRERVEWLEKEKEFLNNWNKNTAQEPILTVGFSIIKLLK